MTYALEGNIAVTRRRGAVAGRVPGPRGWRRRAWHGWPSSVDDTGGLYLVPAFVGLGAPYWNDAARGLISGLTRGSSAAHLARATIEAIAYQVRDVFDVMQREAGTDAHGAAGRRRRQPERC